MIGKTKIGISKHGKTRAKDIAPSIKWMRLEPQDSLKRIFLFKYQTKNLQKGAQALFSFNVNSFFIYSY